MSQIKRRRFFSLVTLFVSLLPRPKQTCLIPGVPAPEFWFGDRVVTEWEVDDPLDSKLNGLILWQAGQIVGLIWSFDFSEWKYQIIWDEFCVEILPQSSYEDDCWESQLELVTQ